MLNKDFLLGFGAGKSAGGGGGGGGKVLIDTIELGALISADTNQHTSSSVCKIPIADIGSFDAIILETTRSSKQDNHHYRTVQPIWVQRDDGISTVKKLQLIGAWNVWESGGTEKATYYQTPFGIYVNTMTISGDETYYAGSVLYRGNNSYSGVIDGDYITNIYGVSLR